MMNETLISLMASLQALISILSYQGVTVSPQVYSSIKNINQTLQSYKFSQSNYGVLNNNKINNKTSFEDINRQTMPAIVNILCTTRSGGALNPISGSGAIVSSDGIIVTNAHVAQYVLLQDLESSPVKCVARSGAPAKAKYNISVLYMPKSWAHKHAKNITKKQQLSTGENDYAFLAIKERIDKKNINKNLPFIKLNTSTDSQKLNEEVFLAGYPAGFLGGITIQKNLWPISTIVKIKKLMTFKDGSVDVLSLGGSIVAQKGSSGGAVVDKRGKLIGLITTTSSGDTTDKRDLRAITVAHINESLRKHTTFGIRDFLTLAKAGTLKDFLEKNKNEVLLIYKNILYK